MPRSKPKAQRLAPPPSNSNSEAESRAPLNVNNANGQGFSDSATVLETVRNTSKPGNFVPSTRELNNPAKRQRSPSQRELLPPSLSNPSHLGNGNAPGIFTATSPSDPVFGTKSKSKKRRKTNDTTQWPASHRQPSPAINPSSRVFPLSNNIMDRHDDVIRTSSDIAVPRSRQMSSSSTDTASVGLAEDIPQANSLEGSPRTYFEEDDILDSCEHEDNQAVNNTSNGRIATNLSKETGQFPRVLDSSRSKKHVEADPTPPSLPPALGEPPNAQNSTKGRREKRKLSFLSDDEAKSVFDREAYDANGEEVRFSQRKIDKEKLRDYWHELETVSIRKSGQKEKPRGKSRHNRLKPMGNDAPSLHPSNHGNVLNVSKKRQREEKDHPITEENIDGGDAIPVAKHRKKKSLKKGKSESGLIGGSADKETEAHPLEQRMSKEAKRKKLSTSRWLQSIKGSNPPGEAAERGRASLGGMRSSVRRGNTSEDGGGTASSTGFTESDGQACMECGNHGKASKMVLCDACSDGCHTFCMRPARTGVPLGVWVCPRCHMLAKKHEIHLSKLGLFLESHGLQCDKARVS